MTQVSLQFYDQAAVTTISEFVNNNQYPQFESVLRKFLLKFNAPSLQHLGFIQLPSLDLLHDIQQKINAFISAYVGTQSLVCFSDLEVELCGMLKSFNFPVRNALTVDDPNEMNIDSNMEQISATTPPCFVMFGMGPLWLHPQIQNLFPDMTSAGHGQAVSTADVIARLEEYTSTHSCSSTGFNGKHSETYGVRDRYRENVLSGVEKIDLLSFQAFLCEYYSASSPLSLGVLIRGSLQAELLMLRHVAARRHELLVSTQKQFFEGMRESHGTSSAVTACVKPAVYAPTSVVKVDLCPPSRPESVALLARFAKKIDSSYAPSFGKAHSVLEDLWREEQKQKGGERVGNEGRKRRRNRGSCCGDDEPHRGGGVSEKMEMSVFEKELLVSATEYVMLHVGGTKYKRKHFCVQQSGDVGSVTNKNMTAALDNVGGSNDGEKSRSGSSDSNNDSESSSGEDSSSEDSSGEDSSGEDSSVEDSSSSSEDGEDTSHAVKTPLPPRIAPPHPPDPPPFEGKMMVPGTAAALPPAIEAIDVAAFLPWCQHNSLPPQASKVDYLRAIGRWGESLVYQYLLYQHSQDRKVTWLNEKEETNASYDLKLERKTDGSGLRTIFVEVKATQFSDKNVFQISKWEWDFMASLPRVQYDIYRVYNAGNGQQVRLVVYHDVLKLVEEKKIQICLAV